MEDEKQRVKKNNNKYMHDRAGLSRNSWVSPQEAEDEAEASQWHL